MQVYFSTISSLSLLIDDSCLVTRQLGYFIIINVTVIEKNDDESATFPTGLGNSRCKTWQFCLARSG